MLKPTPRPVLTSLPKPFYEDEWVTIYNADNRDILPRLNRRFDLGLTDPPYGIGEAAGKSESRGKKLGLGGNSSALAFAKAYGDHDWDNEPAPLDTINKFISLCDHSIIFGGNYYPLPISSCWLVWDKDNGGTDFADCELAWTNLSGAVRMKKYRWKGMLQQDMKNKENRFHPTQKPVPLFNWCLQQAEIKTKNTPLWILDPWAGSGSVGRAAKDLRFNAILIERETSYCVKMAERMCQEVLPL
jgi:DNA modification methylase